QQAGRSHCQRGAGPDWRADPARHPRAPRPQQADLPQERGLWSFRPHGRRRPVPLGADQPGGRAESGARVSGRRRRGRAFLAFAAFGIAIGSVGSPANAQLRSLDLPENAGWQHAETGLVLLAQLAGYRRTSISDTGSAELDVIVEYSAPDQSTFVTLYLFRPALMSVPVWFDRSETQILLSEKYRSAKPSGEARAFAPP